MTSLVILQGAAFVLLALGAVRRLLPGEGAGPVAAVSLLGVGAALIGPAVTLEAGLSFRLDGLSAVAAVVLLLPAVAGGEAVLLGAVLLGLVAGGGLGLFLCLVGAVAARWWLRPDEDAGGGLASGWGGVPARWGGVVGLACLGVALLLLTGWEGSFAAVTAVPPEGWRGGVVLAAALGAALLLPGRAVGVYLLARLLFHVAGPVTPGWWGGPVVVAGAAVAVTGAWQAGRSMRLAAVVGGAGRAAQGVAMMGLGAALVARAADLGALAGFAVSGALVTLLAWGVWGTLLGVCAGVVQAGAGSDGLDRLGGLMRRAPLTGLSMVVALMSMAMLPLSAGFAGVWAVAQGLMGAARSGGVAAVLLAIGGIAVLGLVMAWMAAASVRLGGVVLLGAPRTARAGALRDPGVATRLLLAGLAVGVLGLGVVPGVLAGLVRAGVLVLGRESPGVGLVMSIAVDAPGYAAAGLAGVIAVALGVAGVAGRRAGTGLPGAGVTGAGWGGGLLEADAGRRNTWPVAMGWRVPGWVRSVPAGVAVLCGLALLLAGAVGWAAR